MRGLLAAAMLLRPAHATTVGQGRCIEVGVPAPDAGVWYYQTPATAGGATGSALYFIDVNWPPGDHWGGHCPHGIDIKPLLQQVTGQSLAGLPGRLLNGSGTPCVAPCRHFTCKMLPAGWKPASPPPPPAPTIFDQWAEKYYRNWTYYPEWAIPPSW